MELVEPKGWRKLWEKAQLERDPQKLARLVDQMNQLLAEHEKAAEEVGSASSALERPTQRD